MASPSAKGTIVIELGVDPVKEFGSVPKIFYFYKLKYLN
jgi:hypothetical protein